jgi:hypothetical protein
MDKLNVRHFQEMCSKYGTHYHLPVLLRLVPSTSARRQGAAENPVLFNILSLKNVWTLGIRLEKDCILLTN